MGNIEILIALVGVIVANAASILKVILDNRVRKKRESDIDKIQTARMDEFKIALNNLNNSLKTHAIENSKDNKLIGKNLEELNELHKDSKTVPDLAKNIDIAFKKSLKLKKVDNVEILNFLFGVKVYLKSIAISILHQRFKNVEEGEILSTLEHKFKASKLAMDLNKLELEDPKEFLNKLDINVIPINRDAFVFNLINIIQNNTNGVRRRKFEAHIISYVRFAVASTQGEYIKCKQKKK